MISTVIWLVTCALWWVGGMLYGARSTASRVERAYNQGANDRMQGLDHKQNPHKGKGYAAVEAALWWLRGWRVEDLERRGHDADAPGA